MKAPDLPDNVSQSWFHIHCGGEVYTSKIVRGEYLLRALAEICLGSPDEEHEMIDAYARELADPDFWYTLHGEFVGCSLACGEDPDIEIDWIDDPKVVAMLNASADSLKV